MYIPIILLICCCFYLSGQIWCFSRTFQTWLYMLVSSTCSSSMSRSVTLISAWKIICFKSSHVAHTVILYLSDFFFQKDRMVPSVYQMASPEMKLLGLITFQIFNIWSRLTHAETQGNKRRPAKLGDICTWKFSPCLFLIGPLEIKLPHTSWVKVSPLQWYSLMNWVN